MSQEVIQYLPLESIEIEAQVRENAVDDTLRNLAAALEAVGQLQPIRVRREGERLIVVDGERRLRAASILGWLEIATIVEERELLPSETTQRQLIANCQRKSLTPLETSRAIDDLMAQTGWSQTEVAAQLGVSVGTVSKLLALRTLPAPIQERVQSGAIRPSTAYALTQVADPVKQAAMAAAAEAGDLTRDEAIASAKQHDDASPMERPVVQRLRAAVAQGTVTLSGPSLTPEAIIAMLAELLGKARKLQSRGTPAETFFRSLRTLANTCNKEND